MRKRRDVHFTVGYILFAISSMLIIALPSSTPQEMTWPIILLWLVSIYMIGYGMGRKSRAKEPAELLWF